MTIPILLIGDSFIFIYLYWDTYQINDDSHETNTVVHPQITPATHHLESPGYNGTSCLSYKQNATAETTSSIARHTCHQTSGRGSDGTPERKCHTDNIQWPKASPGTDTTKDPDDANRCPGSSHTREFLGQKRWICSSPEDQQRRYYRRPSERCSHDSWVYAKGRIGPDGTK